MELCKCGCGKEVTKKENKFLTGHNNRGKTKENDKGRKSQSQKLRGRTKETHESVRKQSEKIKGRTKETHESVRKQSEKMKGKLSKKKGKTYEELYGKQKAKELKNSLRQRMKSGQAAYINKFIQNPSKEELKLREICHKVLPYVEPNYPVYRAGKGKRSYNIDNAVPKLNLAIEFDGYFHFCDQKHIDYHKRRQKEIEEEGWRFIRYNIFHTFPSVEKVSKDVEDCINARKN